MQINYDYLKDILDVFLTRELPTADWDSFASLRKTDENKFIFHIEILVDKGLIEGALRGKSIGISRTLEGKYTASIIPWRLTADGHDFAAAITKPSVLATIKEKFKTEGLSVVIDIAKKIAEKRAEKLLGQL